MSSSSSLAAARRRRAMPPNQQQQRVSEPQNVVHSFQHDTQPGVPAQNMQSKASTPMQLLTQHDMRIFSIEQNMTNLGTRIDLANNESANDGMAESVNSMNSRITELENKSHLNQSENISYFKEKYINIEKQLGDMKKLLLKVQTFAMETNLAFLKHKNSLTPSLETIIAKNEALYNTSNNPVNNVLPKMEISVDENNIILNSVQENTSLLSDNDTLDDEIAVSVTDTNDIELTEDGSELLDDNEEN